MKARTWKKLLSASLAGVMALSMLPMAAMAAEASENAIVYTDDTVTYQGVTFQRETEGTYQGLPLFDAEPDHLDEYLDVYMDYIGLDGILITEEGYGNPDTDLMMNCRKVQNAGVDVVLITDEFPGRDGKSLSLADACEEANALASCGNGNVVIHFPPMDRLIGMTDYIEMQIGGWAGCKNDDGSFDAEIQIIIASTIANGFNTLAARGI